MLAPTPFKTPIELDLTPAQWRALVDVLEAMECGEINDRNFNMGCWGTCYVWHANRLAHSLKPAFQFNEIWYGSPLMELCCGYPKVSGRDPQPRSHVNCALAERVLRDYLTTGAVNWE